MTLVVGFLDDAEPRNKERAGQQVPRLHDGRMLIRNRSYARAAARDSSIGTPAGGCAAVHSAACAAPELTLITSAIPYHSR